MPRQRELDREIARLTCRFKSIDDVECVYLTPYEYMHNPMKIFHLTVITTTKTSRKLIDRIVKDYNEQNRSEEMLLDYDGLLLVGTDKPDNYSTQVDMFSSQEQIVAAVDIISSKILYDRNGFYTRVANQFNTDDPKKIKLKPYKNILKMNDINENLFSEFEPKNNQ